MPVITPFKEDLGIDWEGLDKLVEYTIHDMGCAAILPCGTTGESPTLSHEEHTDKSGQGSRCGCQSAGMPLLQQAYARRYFSPLQVRVGRGRPAHYSLQHSRSDVQEY